MKKIMLPVFILSVFIIISSFAFSFDCSQCGNKTKDESGHEVPENWDCILFCDGTSGEVSDSTTTTTLYDCSRCNMTAEKDSEGHEVPENWNCMLFCGETSEGGANNGSNVSATYFVKENKTVDENNKSQIDESGGLNDCFEEMLKNGKSTMIKFGDQGSYPAERLYENELAKYNKGEFKDVDGYLLTKLTKSSFDDTTFGDFLRSAKGTPDPYTYDKPLTKSLFQKIDAIQGTETEKIEKIYNLITEAVPEYHAEESERCVFVTFEDMLAWKKGICRDYSALFKAALTRKGIDAQFARDPNHIWIRVTIHQQGSACDGKTIDLDPTWYLTFMPLYQRNDLPSDAGYGTI